MPRNYSTIDIGTNAYKITIEDEKGVTQMNLNLPSKRLNQSLNVDGDYLVACLKEFDDELNKHNLSLKNENVKVIATENFRKVENSEKVLENIKETLGVDIEIISKERESDLGMKGALSRAKGIENKNVMYVDLGGGSTEISMNSNESKSIVASVSIPIGSRYLLEELNTAGKSYEKLILSNIKKDIIEYIKEFKSQCDFDKLMKNMIVLTNASPVLRIMNKDMGLERYEPQQIQGNERNLKMLSNELSKVAEMKPHHAISEGYSAYKAAPQVITGAFIMKEILNELDLSSTQEIQASIFGVKEGLIAEMKEQKNKENTKKLSIQKPTHSLGA